MTDTHPAPTSADARVTAVLTGLHGVRGCQEGLYRDVHRHPELSHQEHRTAGLVADRLRTAGFQVHDGVGGTGVVGVLSNGDGPTVLIRADMDALPVREATGLSYASSVTGTDSSGNQVPVMHACGHDVHVTCLAGAAQLLADHRDNWHGTLVALFQPAEKTGDGARGMLDDRLADLIPAPDVALAQHVLPFPAGQVRTRPGPTLSEADSVRVTLHGRGAHGSMPQAAVDPVVLAASVVLRLQTIVSRETTPGDPAVLTVGSIQAGSKSNVIPDTATLLLNIRTYSDATRAAILDGVRRIVTAECAASASPREPEFELFDHFPLTDNDPDATSRVADAFAQHFGDRATALDRQSASEDFSDIPTALGVPYTYWGIGGIRPRDVPRRRASRPDQPGHSRQSFRRVRAGRPAHARHWYRGAHRRGTRLALNRRHTLLPPGREAQPKFAPAREEAYTGRTLPVRICGCSREWLR